MSDFYDFLIIGGGIAGVVCAETLCELLSPSPYSLPGDEECAQSTAKVCLITASNVVKTAVNVQRVTRLLEAFDVSEKPSDELSMRWPTILTVVIDMVQKLDCANRCVYLIKRNPIHYGRICLATGGIPRAIEQKHPLVLTLRDTESISQFRQRLGSARRILLVGNGGIATEVAYAIEDCQVIWIVKHNNISVPFLDPAASQFILQSRNAEKLKESTSCEIPVDSALLYKSDPLIRTLRYTLADRDQGGGDSNRLVPLEGDGRVVCPREAFGSALGPDWTQGHKFTGIIGEGELARPLKVVYRCQVDRIMSPHEFQISGSLQAESDSEGILLPETITNWPIYVRLTNGEVYGCDFLINATGVDANLGPDCASGSHAFTADNSALRVASAEQGGGIVVNELMQSSVPEVYAVGDCAFAGWAPAPHWFQMRLWLQARQMAFQAAKSMYYHNMEVADVPLDFSFEIFTHMTFFFGFKVVLLGLYNGQRLEMTSPDCHVLLRITPNKEYIKCIMKDGRMQGTLLIGDTDLEETFENLILNQLDLSSFGEHLLDPNVDLSDFFD